MTRAEVNDLITKRGITGKVPKKIKKLLRRYAQQGELRKAMAKRMYEAPDAKKERCRKERNHRRKIRRRIGEIKT